MKNQTKNQLDEKFLISQKSKLKKNLEQLEKDIRTVTKKKNGKYQIVFPNLGSNEDDNAQEVQVYEDNISIKKNLEEMIKKHQKAIKKIQNNKYGFCEVCKKSIRKDRLTAFPEAEYCSQHAK